MTATPTSLDRLLSTRSVREALDVSDRCLRRWVAAGKFPPADLQIGTTLRWRQSTLTRFIEHGVHSDTNTGMSLEAKRAVNTHNAGKNLTR